MEIKVQPFYLKRNIDESGVSGTGIVAIGAEFYPSGVCVIKWLTTTSSLGIYDNINELKEIHSHGGKTEVIMGDFNDKTRSKRKTRNSSKRNNSETS